MDITNIIDPNNPVTYRALQHGTDYQPPVSIRKFKALGRDVLLNGIRTQFYFGQNNHATRVNFCFGGIWYHIRQGDQDVDVNGQNLNLFPLLQNLHQDFKFVTYGS